MKLKSTDPIDLYSARAMYKKNKDMTGIRAVLEDEVRAYNGDHDKILDWLTTQRVTRRTILQNLDILPLSFILQKQTGKKEFREVFWMSVLSYYVLNNTKDVTVLCRLLTIVYGQAFLQALVTTPLQLQYKFPVYVPLNNSVPEMSLIIRGVVSAMPQLPIATIVRYWHTLLPNTSVEQQLGSLLAEQHRAEGLLNLQEYISSVHHQTQEMWAYWDNIHLDTNG